MSAQNDPKTLAGEQNASLTSAEEAEYQAIKHSHQGDPSWRRMQELAKRRELTELPERDPQHEPEKAKNCAKISFGDSLEQTGTLPEAAAQSQNLSARYVSYITPTEHEKREWSRMARAAYAEDRNEIGHQFSAYSALLHNEAIPTARFDELQAQYQQWLVFGFGAPVSCIADTLAKPLPAYRVTKPDGTSYVTSMAAGITLEEARRYFTGRTVEVAS